MNSQGSERLKGRVAFVIGLSGIGLACVERFLAEGAQVMLCDLDAPDSAYAVESAPTRCTRASCSLRN
jgi:NAD(P)-dependent dehydrogenase (short-subunit alcohol dehydrogenase family)